MEEVLDQQIAIIRERIEEIKTIHVDNKSTRFMLKRELEAVIQNLIKAKFKV